MVDVAYLVVGEDHMTVQKRLVERNRCMTENKVERADHITDCVVALCIPVLVKVLVVKLLSQPYPYGDFYHWTYLHWTYLHGLPSIVYTLVDLGLTVLILYIIAAGLYNLRFTVHTRPMSRLSTTATATTFAMLAGAFWWTMWS